MSDDKFRSPWDLPTPEPEPAEPLSTPPEIKLGTLEEELEYWLRQAHEIYNAGWATSDLRVASQVAETALRHLRNRAAKEKPVQNSGYGRRPWPGWSACTGEEKSFIRGYLDEILSDPREVKTDVTTN